MEHLDQRFLLTADTTDPAYVFTHLKPGAQHDLSVLEYDYPDFNAALTAALALGIDPIPAQPGTLSDGSTGRAKRHHPRGLLIEHSALSTQHSAFSITPRGGFYAKMRPSS